jgi:hypothetical protein
MPRSIELGISPKYNINIKLFIIIYYLTDIYKSIRAKYIVYK